MVFLSELLGKPVLDSTGKELGILYDLIFQDGSNIAPITHFVYRCQEKYKKRLPWKYVKGLKQVHEQKTIFSLLLNASSQELEPAFVHENDLLARELLDKQIIDVSGLKVVRVNDVLLNKIDEQFAITGVCVGLASFLRRLGFEKEGLFGQHLFQVAKEKIISWKYVEPLTTDTQNVHLREAGNKIAELHPGDIADLMEELNPKERILIFNKLDKQTAAKTLIEADEAVQESFFKGAKIQRIIDLLESLPASRAADLLRIMDEEAVKKILAQVRQDTAAKITDVLKYQEDTAGGLMRTEVFILVDEDTTQKALQKIRKERPEQVQVLHIVDKENHLVGTVSMRSLLTAKPRAVLKDFMRKDPIALPLTALKEDIATALEKYNYVTLPVIDQENKLHGIITADDVLSEIIPESWMKRRFVPHRAKKKKG